MTSYSNSYDSSEEHVSLSSNSNSTIRTRDSVYHQGYDAFMSRDPKCILEVDMERRCDSVRTSQSDGLSSDVGGLFQEQAALEENTYTLWKQLISDRGVAQPEVDKLSKHLISH